ncbi:MAG: class E sortase [Marmoricola sp.]|nr:class E sortase [Marmoricola sp.]
MVGSGGRRGRGGVLRRAARWLGILMLVAGVALLGYVGWQFWGSNWTSHRAQQAVTQNLEKEWHAPSARQKLQPRFVPQGRASALIRIPAFGRGYVVPVLEGTSQAVLAKGYGHFRGTAQPGEVGNYALAAHRVTHGEPLRRMPELRPGDKVIVETVSDTYTYRLDTNPNQLIVPFTGVWVLEPDPTNPSSGGVQPAQTPGQRLITLTTCSELFHTDNRMIAFGHLVKVTPKETSTQGG